MSNKVEIVGLKEVLNSIEGSRERLENAAAAATRFQALALDELVNRKGMVPIRSGNLQASHYVTEPVKDGETWKTELGYGADYAGAVHERPAGNVLKGASERTGQEVRYVGSSRWLSRGTNIWARAYQVRMMETTWAFFKRGIGPKDVPGGAPTSPQTGTGDLKGNKKILSGRRNELRRFARKAGARYVRRFKRPRRKGG